MMTTTHPTGRMLKRALSFEPRVLTDEEKQLIETAFNSAYRNNMTPLICFRRNVLGYSLNTTGVQFRVRQLQWDCIRFRKGLGELYTPQEQNEHISKPVTKKDILTGYLMAARYNNNFKPRV